MKKSKSWYFTPAILMSFSFILNSCASLSDSLLVGIGSGAVTGAVIGSQGDEGSDRAGSAAAIGAVAGGIVSYFIHKGLEKRDERQRRETLLNLGKFDVSSPYKPKGNDLGIEGGHYLTKPSVDMDWVETRVEGDKLIEGHRVWKITEKSKWIPQDDNKVQKAASKE